MVLFSRRRNTISTSTDPAPRKTDIKRYRRNLKAEAEGAALYRALAESERNENLATLYRRMARVESRHVEFWHRRLREIGAPEPSLNPGPRVLLLSWLARRFGARMVLPAVRSMELTAAGVYEGQADAEAAGLDVDERSHARVFKEMSDSAQPDSDRIARVEGRHRFASGNMLRAGVLGANDGLVSSLSLIMGVSGADPGRNIVLLAGISGVLAGSFSMALGEWVSVQSTRELYERQLQIEADELDTVPAEEREELALIYEAKGIDRATARAMSARIIEDRSIALQTLGREELGIDEREIGSPWTAASTSFLVFAGAALIPVIPFMFGAGTTAVVVSAIGSAVALFLLGAGITLFTGRGVLFSGSRQAIIGLGAAAVTFVIGSLIGAGIGLS